MLVNIKQDFNRSKAFRRFYNSIFIGFCSVALFPIGLAAALLTQINPKLRELFYSLSIMPVLFPGVIIGISTVVLWNRLSGLSDEGILSEVGEMVFSLLFWLKHALYQHTAF